MARLGIDISAHQGDIDLAALKRNGVQFAIIRVGYGVSGSIDSKFRRNADLCKSIGLPFGFYWYSYALDVDGAAEEARHFLNAVAPYKDSYSMGCWFDMEDADGYKRRNGMPSNSTLRAMCAKFCEIVENAGYYAGIYASQSWFNNQLNGGEINRYDKWVAQWPTNGSIQKGLATPASAKSGVNLWQFTSAGRISGYNGNLDCNYAYKDKMINIIFSGINSYLPLLFNSSKNHFSHSGNSFSKALPNICLKKINNSLGTTSKIKIWI